MGDKCLRRLGARPILEHVIERARPQVAALVLNANSDPSRFAAFGLPVVGDVIADFAGPLAGVLTGMEWARAHRPECPWIATIATDTPFFPDLVGRRLAAVDADGADLACAASGVAPTRCSASVWPACARSARGDGRRGIAQGRRLDRPSPLGRSVFATDPIDPSFNTNRPEDLAGAEHLLRADREVPRAVRSCASSRTAQSRDLPT